MAESMTAEANRVRALNEADAWALLQALAARASAGRPIERVTALRLDASGMLEEVSGEAAWLEVDPAQPSGLAADQRFAPAVADLLELYLPLCVGAHAVNAVIAHVGQSLDGQIATTSGASRYVTGPENIRHLHRLRALFEVVLVGAGTVDHDDPRLTTRLVAGKSPTRVVVDPQLRLSDERALFQDQAARTIVLCAQGRERARRMGNAELIPIADEQGVLPPGRIVRALAELGLRRLFIEGGGVTVSRFLEARALHRLQVTIGPLFIGKGRAGISLPGVESLDRALRPRTRRFNLGEDVLFDCELSNLT